MNGYPHSDDDQKINSQYQKLLNTFKQSANEAAYSTDVKEHKHGYAGSTKSNEGVMHGPRMDGWTNLLEAMEDVAAGVNAAIEDPMQTEVGEPTPVETGAVPSPEPAAPAPTTQVDDNQLLDDLNKIFTPVLVMQGFENDVADKMQDAMSEAAVFTEKNVIQFDDETRMAQLISVCALLIARAKNTEKYRMYAQAHKVRNQMKLEIQKDEYDQAKVLAQKYLVKVSTTNNNSVARQAATDLLPITNN